MESKRQVICGVEGLVAAAIAEAQAGLKRTWRLAPKWAGDPDRLEATGYSIYSRGLPTLRLTPLFAAQLDAVWTKRKRYGSEDRIGALTLAGLCQRLGRDIGAEIIKPIRAALAQARRDQDRDSFRRAVMDRLVELARTVQHAREKGVTISDEAVGNLFGLADELKPPCPRCARGE